MNAWDGIFFIGIAAMFGLALWRRRVRASGIRRLAQMTGFHYLADTIPQSILKDLPAGITSVWNVLEGERSGRRVIAFDCRFGSGKGSLRRTVIAIQADRSSITASAFDPDIQVEQIGEWTFLYRPKELAVVAQLTPLSELSAYLEAV
ncbi:hypothetical protein [Occallatibacter savannae]|uniref:hypothetical protein n=1 Tax=Occallatibacter savannae TaxID=1002691 RepID=UPI00194E71BF|nr:hypothetical protein [Occallatibacter savannae]